MNHARPISNLMIALALFGLPLVAQAADNTKQQIKKGFVTGKVLNADGQPIPNAEVIADNTLYYNTNVIGYTNARGEYSLDVRQPLGTWNITARMRLKYEGTTVDVDLIPENEQLVAGNVGGVRNFVFRPANTTYGNLGIVNVRMALGFYAEPSQMKVILKPVGKLADGTTGKTREATLDNTGDGYIVKNVMYGTYEVTITLNGKPLYVRKAQSSGGQLKFTQKSFKGGFWKDFYALRPTMFLEISDDDCPDILQECQGQ
ncbi:carboxypeptidase-like regulatory domain-containing protein [Deinococcus roseus]|uniref:Carboxypeptidase regulatory-like domain-containing protein n=1 Tax=Deinococcus roseus TaxID=392414 RepID=A0ABQ2CWY9_9DEIO|nr:carboxypeptidase-like regulatory domain-containing protein [Deinococcus roseus]GGJ28935.1 hypothetical protein GCM10008938_13780 [Deinococcus roseus]